MAKLSDGEIKKRLGELEGWSVSEGMLNKGFDFDGFMDALEFVVDIGGAAEEMGHHPEILLAYGSVDISIWTDSEKGLTEKDFELAKKIDEIDETPPDDPEDDE